MIKTAFYDTYIVQVLDKSHDGILIVCFQDKQIDFSFIILSCYNPPDGSIYGNVIYFIFDVLSEIYLYQHGDLIFMCGDLNVKIGKLPDATDINNLTNRWYC